MLLFKKEKNKNWEIINKPINENDINTTILIMQSGLDFSEIGEIDETLEPYDFIENIQEVIEHIEKTKDNYFEIGDKSEVNLLLDNDKIEVFYEDTEMKLNLIEIDNKRNLEIYQAGDKTLAWASYIKLIIDTIHNSLWFKFEQLNGTEWIYVNSPNVKNKSIQWIIAQANKLFT